MLDFILNPSTSWSVLLALAIATTTLTLSTNLNTNSLPFKRVGKPWILSLLSGPWAMSFTIEKHVQEGYDKIIKATSKPFIMRWWALDYIFLPPKYLPDLKRADAHHLSFFENISLAFSLDTTVGDLYSSNLMADVVRRGINPRLAKLTPLLQSEADYAFSQEIGPPSEEEEDWRVFTAAALFGNMMHRVTSRILIGPELCRDEAYLKTSQSLGDSIFINGLVMSMLPPLPSPIRNLLKRVLSIFHKRILRRAVAVIFPLVQKRLDEFEAAAGAHSGNHHNPGPGEGEGEGEGEKEVLDAIQWTISLTKTLYPQEHNPHRIALSLLHNLWSGSAAPGGTVTQMVFQVLSEPTYLEPLRSEAAQVFALHGEYTERSLNNLPLLDSFIREINRLYPTGAVTCARTVTDRAGYEFSDGLRLPAGSRVAIPALAIQTDPENYQDPLRFDGWRFARLRQQAGTSGASADYRATGEREQHGAGAGEEESKFGASTVSESYLPFGIGRHSCPGRFYAIRMIKIIFTKLILEYDIKWDREESQGRPSSLSLNGQFAPNQGQKIWLRTRN